MSRSFWSARRAQVLCLALTALAQLPATAEAAGTRVQAGEIAGRYSILRAEDKDTGCMLTLKAGMRAQLAPACRDNGMVIFDPVSWSIERGRLALTARKGHKAYFDRSADGIWRRDAKEGKALSLKPL